MVRKSKKGIVGKNTVPGSGIMPGPGIDLVDNNLKSSKEIQSAADRQAKKEGLE
jgi:hypothetical protein